MLEYKGYHAEINHNDETNYYCGCLYGIRALVMFGGETKQEVEADFRLAVEDYLEFCRADGEEPNREENSKDLKVRVNADFYKNLKDATNKSDKNFNDFVEKILTDYVAKTA